MMPLRAGSHTLLLELSAQLHDAAAMSDDQLPSHEATVSPQLCYEAASRLLRIAHAVCENPSYAVRLAPPAMVLLHDA
jgi:hypothetical protein